MIIGVDPGTTTGICVLDDGLTVLRELSARLAVEYVWSLLDRAGSTVIVACERFDIDMQTIRSKRNYDALHVAGALRFKTELVEGEYVEYRRADAKHFATNDKLKTLRLFTSGSKQHRNDAARQVVMHLAKIDPSGLARGLR